MTVGGSASSSTASKSSVGNNPSSRMKAGLAICKGHLYLYGGIFEEENKQHTLSDFYSIGKLNHSF